MLDIRAGTMRMVTACDRLVARRVLPRQVSVARHFNVVVLGVQGMQSILASDMDQIIPEFVVLHRTYKIKVCSQNIP